MLRLGIEYLLWEKGHGRYCGGQRGKMLACCLGPEAGFLMASEQCTAAQPLRYKMKVEVGDYASPERRVEKFAQLFRSGFPISWWEDLLPGGEEVILSTNCGHSRYTIHGFRVFRNDITSQTRLRIEHVSSSCPFTESQRDFTFFILFPPIIQYCVMSLWKALVCIYKIWARFYMDIWPPHA